MKSDLRNKYHLYNRTCFFVHHDAVDQHLSIEKIVDRMIENQTYRMLHIDMEPFDQEKLDKLSGKKKREKLKTFRQQSREFNAIWVKYMVHTDSPFIEKMSLFWHEHFACKTDQNPHLCMEMCDILRRNALGNFKTLLYDVSRSSSMIGYLHLRQNRKAEPNEDFARELLELFTLGRDVDYTEKDIQEIARAFTGWTTNMKGEFFFNELQHDTGEKTIFGKTGNFKGEDVLDMLLENKNTARYIASKLYRFFVEDNDNAEAIDELTAVFYSSGYDISAAMKHLLKADWFYESQGELIKGPIDLIVGLGRMFNLQYAHEKTLLGLEHYFGQVLFSPPNVAGWPGGRQWIDSSRLALRIRLGSLILNRGYIEDELSPELDAMLKEKQKKEKLVFHEEIDWDRFFERNKEADLFDLIIRSENEKLRSSRQEHTRKNIIQLVSTPDFQLI